MSERDEHRTWEAAQRQGACLIHCARVKLDEDIDPLALYATLPATARDVDPEEIFVWHTRDRGWIVALGQIDQRFLPAHASLPVLEEARQTWRARLPEHLDPTDVVMVGGVGFADGATSPMWADFGQTSGWIPRWYVRQRPDGLHAHTCYLIHPDHTRAHVDRVHTHQREVLDAWLESARLISLEAVSRETSATWHEPRAAAWGALVARATEAMRQPDASFDKVVLARTIDSADVTTSPVEALGALIDAYPGCTHFAVHPRGGHGPALLGATPEQLVCTHQGTLHVDALAGSIAPGPQESSLLESPKDLWEHDIVVQEIRAALEDIAALEPPQGPGLKRLRNVTHLHTPVTGQVDPDLSVLELGARLHPTPAICGRPRVPARDWLLEAESNIEMSRGWYCGALGYAELGGDGELDVAIRCALLSESSARVFVGAGIVADSDPDSELQETFLKSHALTRALGGPR